MGRNTHLTNVTTAQIPIAAATTAGAVSLTVASLGQAVDFYTSRLGLQVLKQQGETVHLGVGAVELLVLHGNLGDRRVPRTSGLYHFALLVPTRRALGAAIVLYGLAKIFELFDPQIFAALGGVAGGHALKHLSAAAACASLVGVVRAVRPS